MLKEWGLGLQHMNLRGTQFNPEQSPSPQMHSTEKNPIHKHLYKLYIREELCPALKRVQLLGLLMLAKGLLMPAKGPNGFFTDDYL